MASKSPEIAGEPTDAWDFLGIWPLVLGKSSILQYFGMGAVVVAPGELGPRRVVWEPVLGPQGVDRALLDPLDADLAMLCIPIKLRLSTEYKMAKDRDFQL